jgi:hypothetical protein
MREIRRRTRVVGAFPEGNSALPLVSARLRHIAGKTWGAQTLHGHDPPQNPADRDHGQSGPDRMIEIPHTQFSGGEELRPSPRTPPSYLFFFSQPSSVPANPTECAKLDGHYPSGANILPPYRGETDEEALLGREAVDRLAGMPVEGPLQGGLGNFHAAQIGDVFTPREFVGHVQVGKDVVTSERCRQFNDHTSWYRDRILC